LDGHPERPRQLYPAVPLPAAVVLSASAIGRRVDPDVALELVDHRTFDGRLQLLEYVPTVLDAPPGVGDWPSD